MNDPNLINPKHPRLQMHGPRAGVPAVGSGGGGGELPYAGAPGHRRGPRRAALGALAVVAAMGAGGAAVAVVGNGGGDRAASVPASGAGRPSSTTTIPVTTTSTTAPPTTTTIPVTTTTVSPTAHIPVNQLPRHEAIYRDGKLVLQGTVPTAAIREKFRSKAAAVIGAENVIVRYRIDPRVPIPTDGRVRVDEEFIFPKNSAAIDKRYESLMQLGVAVLRLNPHARMRINGYTDDSGTDAVNLRLSQARADALKGYIVGNGIDPSRIDAVGRGEVDFVAPNDTEANRGRNRRIEVDLVGLLAE